MLIVRCRMISIARRTIPLVLHIVLQYTFIQMKHAVSDSEYRALAELRYRIRHFIQEAMPPLSAQISNRNSS